MSTPQSAQEPKPEAPSDIEPVGVIGQIWIEAGRAFSGASRLKVRGLNATQEKDKVSLTLDRELIRILRSEKGPKGLSATVNELLYAALEQAQLRTLVNELETEGGEASQDTYQRILDQWLEEE